MLCVSPIPAKSFLCPVLLGRDLDLTALRALIDEARRGAGHTVLIAGEAGVGKTRLVAEATAYAVAQGYQQLQGACFQTDRSSPYAPIIDLMRTRFANLSATAIMDELGPMMQVLSPLLPELVSPSAALSPLRQIEQSQDKLQLLSAFVWFFLKQATLCPTLLIIEDLHWSDEASLECLYLLARRYTRHPLMLLLTYRDDERNPRLRHWLARLRHDRISQEITLRRLTMAETAEMLTAIHPDHDLPRAEFVKTIYELTEGNPFFVEEVLSSLITSRAPTSGDSLWDHWSPNDLPIPRSIEDTVQRRTERLNRAARELANLAAVAGRRFDLDLLLYLTGYSESRLLLLLKELIAYQLVIEESADRYAFRHALTREAIYAELLRRERQALHRQIGEAIEEVYVDSLGTHIGDLARHWHLARQWDKALTYSHQAGSRALLFHAPREAIVHFTHALEAAERSGIPASGDMFRGRGQAFEWVGEFAAARQDYEAALAWARSAHDDKLEWQVLLDLGLLWAQTDHGRSRDCYEQALVVARAQEEPALLAHTLNRLGNWHINADEPAEGQRCHQEALGIFEAADDRSGRAMTLDLLGMTACLGGDLLQSTGYYREAIALFEELDDRRGLVSSLATLAYLGGAPQAATVVLGLKSQKAIESGERGLRIAREIGWRSGEAYAQVLLGACLSVRGEYHKALPHLHGALTIAQDIDHGTWTALAHTALGAVYLDLLNLTLARQHLEQALAIARKIGFVSRLRSVAGLLANVYTAAGEFQRADDLVDEVLGLDAPFQTIAQRGCWCARCEAALARGESERALAIADQLVATAHYADPLGESGIPRLAMLRGEALAMLKRPREAEAAFLSARKNALAQEAKPLLWQVNAALGHLYQNGARRVEAEAAFEEARKVAGELATAIPDAELRSSFLARTAILIPGESPPSPRQAARQAFHGLTEREREVATLVAAGRTNQQIADELVLSKRTIETHVGSIMAKLACHSRAQVAVWATQKGLGKTPI
jgi:DNA-binding CsgD family transcriptional regulator